MTTDLGQMKDSYLLHESPPYTPGYTIFFPKVGGAWLASCIFRKFEAYQKHSSTQNSGFDS